jgi:transposase
VLSSRCSPGFGVAMGGSRWKQLGQGEAGGIRCHLLAYAGPEAAAAAAAAVACVTTEAAVPEQLAAAGLSPSRWWVGEKVVGVQAAVDLQAGWLLQLLCWGRQQKLQQRSNSMQRRCGCR